MQVWDRVKWYGVLAIGVAFMVGSGYIFFVVSRDPFAFAAFAFGLFMAAMALHELWPWLIEGRPVSPDLVLQRFPGPVVLRTPWRKIVFFLIGTILFGGCLGWMALHSDVNMTSFVIMGIGAIGCAAAVPAFVLLLFRGSALRLEREGFHILHAVRRSFHRWSDTSEFSVVDVGTAMVVFDEVTLMGGTLAQFNRSMVGHGGGLPDTYGMDAWALAELINAWRARALAGAATPQPPSRSAPAP